MSDTLARLSAALADRYAIERELGAGGMATVFLAQDLRHQRKVAVKVLRPELAAVIGAERFLHEITTTANLQHPHILALHDSGTVDGTVYYVMPFVEGETLRDRLVREKQLPIEEAVRLAREVAGALDYAHRHGVIHRDIKPENILLHDGSALVADFGIALAATTAGGGRMTETGMSLGTPTYMSPEQAMGERALDSRTDIYALGCVLYEMLTGEPPFSGPTAQAIVAKVMTAEPVRPTELRKTVPPHVEAAVITALAKLPADRFPGAAAFSAALANPTYSSLGAAGTAPAGGLVPPGSWPRRNATILTAATVLILGVVAALGWLRPTRGQTGRTIRFLYSGTDSAKAVENFPWPAAISPDGGIVAYAVASPTGGSSLYTRRSDQLEGRPVPGTAGGAQPVFSPDGEWLAFEADGKEKKVRLDGSAPVTIAEGAAANGADWTTTGELVVGATRKAHGLSRVSVAGGELTPFTHPDSAGGEADHLWPIGMADGRMVVFTVWSGALSTAQLAVASLDGGEVTRLGLKGIRPLAVLDGDLVYLQADGAVMAVPLDVPGRKVKGKPVPVHDPVPIAAANNGNSAIFVSREGALVTGSAALLSRLSWVGHDGAAHPITQDLRNFSQPRISPDGRRIAVIVTDGSGGDVWVLDLETNTLSRLTTTGTVTSAEWTRDGTRVVYSAGGSESRAAIWSQAVQVAAAPERLVQLSDLSPVADISPDGRSLLVQSLVENDWNIVRISLDSTSAILTYVASAAVDMSPQFSPDGRWAALSSGESGSPEVYVRSFPEPSVKVQVSVGGGSAPVWSADGSRLYYLSGSAIIEARLETAPSARVISRDTAFTRVRTGATGFRQANFDVSRDGSRIILPVSQSDEYRLIIAPNWLSEFRERLAASRK